MMPEDVPAIRPGQLALEFGHTPSLAEDDFFVGGGNRLAYEHLRRWPHWPGPLTLIEGPPKSGKSHLARIWAERSRATVVRPADAAVVGQDAGETPLIIEDVDRAGFPEAALFHLVNQAIRSDRSVLMTARAPISEWPYRTDDLKSRARLAARFSVEPSDDIQLSQMFVKLFGDRQIAVDPKIIAYVVTRMERSPEEVVALVGLLDTLALERKVPITRGLAAEALAMRGVMNGSEADDVPLEGDFDE